MTQDLIFSQLLTNQDYSRVVLHHLKDEYFESPEAKNFLKIYRHFFGKFNKVPSKRAMLLEIENLKSSADVYKSMVDIVEKQVEFTESLEYLIETTEKFCKEKALFSALKQSILIVDGQSKTHTPDSIPTILQDALGVCFDTKVGSDYLSDAEDRFDYYHTNEARIKTGIEVIDKITKGGFPRKTLNVLLAPPHGGKTLVKVNIGAGAILNGYNVLYITAEMAENEIGRRFDVNLMDVDFDTLEMLPKATFMSRFSKVTEKSRGRLMIKEYPTGMATTAHFRTLLGELKTKQNFVPDLIIVDYLNICGSEHYKVGSNHNSYTIIGSVGKELRALGIEYNAAILTSTQTNRAGVNNSDVDMTNVSDSASTSMIADFMLGIINTDDLKQLKQIMFKQIKNRYAGIADIDKFLMGVDYTNLKLFSLDSSASTNIPVKQKKTPKIETATDTFVDMGHTITASDAFADFNF